MSDFAEASAKQWEKIVEHARRGRDPKELADKNTSEASIRGKMKAVRWAVEAGWTYEDITEKGQTAVRSAYERSKRNGMEKYREIKYRLPASLAEAIQWSDRSSPDAEEALMSRFRRLGITTSTEAFEFINSTFADMADEEILNRRGAFTEKDAPKKRTKSRT